jgi:diacylglycerol kinase
VDVNSLKNKTLGQSFKNAFNGIYQAVVSERNLRIHTVATAFVIIAGIILGLDTTRWIFLVLAIGLVLISELLNTSLEKLTDMVTSEYSEEARKVKDISAAAVLISAVLSVIVGLLVFYRPLMDLLKKF